MSATLPTRIISIVPSQTELLYHLGLNEKVVGITKFCIHPNEWFQQKTRVGGTKTIDIEKVRLLQPDLIIANKEENVREQVELLQQIAPVYVSDINTLDDAIEMISAVGALTGTSINARRLISDIQNNFNLLSSVNNRSTKIITSYLIWKDPYMAAGSNTFINDMMSRCGLHNVFASLSRYPKISINQLLLSQCKLLLLSSEPYPFKQEHMDQIQKELPHTKILLVDGEMFSWYGSRLLLAPTYFARLLAQVNS